MFTDINQIRGSDGAAQNGSALILALLVLLVMTVVVMGMATDSELDLKVSRNLQLKEQAFNNAETGIDVAVSALRHQVVDKYSEIGSNYEAVYFDNYILTISNGLDRIYYYGGDLMIRSNGKEIASIIIDSHEYKNEDRRWFSLYSTGYNSDKTIENISLAIKEIDTSMNINSPLSLLNKDPSLTIRDNTWISYKNHNVPEEFYCKGSDCSNVSYSINGKADYSIFSLEELDLRESGIPGNQIDGDIEFGPSEFDQDYWLDRANNFKTIAEGKNRVFINEDPADLGTREKPKITVLDGVNINNVHGSGVLILIGGARITGNAHFEGLIIYILGHDDDAALFSGGSNTIFGGMVVLGDRSEVELEEESSEYVEFAGNPYIKFSRQALLSATLCVNNNAPFEKLSWKSE
ncbi:PilX N-terminal domain-containing pilus assembly protein [Desulfonatronospira sp.]|uniref:PilX N-terminal domain-containing pilus assembly protein n=1 Tax=Desulfonatronospira sp. TaxID=1962951 RepID=UPI0025BDEFBF|nr:PilX N-terminal domain-containing pilus assembly protein [Desulfonatronospira sp.]